MKVLLLMAAMIVTLSANAQKILQGSKPSLKGEAKINLKLDLTDTRIDNKSIADWLEYRQAEQPDYNAKDELEKELKPEIQEKIVKELNDKLGKKGAFVTINGSAKYTLLVCPVSIKKNGKNTNECSILDENGNVLVKFLASGSGGTFGSMANLIGDGYENSGSKMASFVAKCF